MVRTPARVGSSCATPAHHPDPEESLHLSELQAAHLSVDACGSAPMWLQRVTVSVTNTAPGIANGIRAPPHTQHPRNHLADSSQKPP